LLHDALKYIPRISKQRGFDAELRVSFLHEISRTVEQVDRSLCDITNPSLANGSTAAIQTTGRSLP
jgi:hypothetical protein